MNLMELFVKIGADTSDFDDKISGIGDKVKSGIGGALSTAAKAGAAGLAAASGAVVAFGKSAIDSGKQFDSAMSQVAATMGKPVAEIQDLRDFAQEMGATTKFSATEAAEALNYMALAGYQTDESMKMLPTVLDLASAGNINLARASDMVTDAQSALGLTFEETETMVDQMAKTASTTNTSVEQLGDAMLTIGATARGVKGGTAELSQVLGLLADNGIKGAEGGTHLRNILLSLQTPTKDGIEALEQLGMSYADMYDEAGNMRSLPEIFQQLEGAMEGMTQQSKDAIMSGIFNKTDLAAVNALVGTDKERWDAVAGAIDNAKGSAKEMAATQLDNLEGDMTLFQSALEGARIAVSDKLTPTLREFVQLGTSGLSDITLAFKEGGLEGAVGAFEKFISNGIAQITKSLPKIIDAGAKVLSAVLKGISNNIRQLAKAAVQIVSSLVKVIVQNLPLLISSGVELIKSLAVGIAQELPNLIPVIIEAIKGIGDVFPEGIKKYILPTFGSITAFLDDVFKGDWAAAWAEISNIFHNAFTGVKDFILNAFTKAKDAVTTIDWLGLGTNIVSTILSGLTEFQSMMLGIFTGTVNTILEIDWGSVGTKIFTLITNAFTQFVEYVKNIFVMAKNAIAEIDWAEVGHQIVDFFVSSFEAIIDGVQGIDWLGLGKAILDYIITAFEAAAELFGTIFMDIWNYVSQIDWLGLGSTIWTFITNAFADIGTWALEKFGELAEWIKSVDWVEVGTAIWDFIISAFMNVGEWALEKFQYLGDVIKSIDWLEVGNKIWDTIISAFSNVWGWAKEKFEYLGKAIKSVNWVEVGQKIWDGIKAGVGFVTRGVGKVVQWAIDFGDEIKDKIKDTDWEDLGDKIWTGIKTGVGYLNKGAGRIVIWAKNLGGEIYDNIKEVKWEFLGDTIWTGIKTGVGYLTKHVGRIVTWAVNLGGEIKDGILGEGDGVGWNELGSKLWGKFKAGIGFIGGAAWKGIGAVFNWAIELGGQIKDGIFTTNWWQVGTNMWDNLKSAFGDVKSWFEGMFDFSGIHIKLPHFEVTEWKSFGPIDVPWSWSWEWRAKGYTNPLLFDSVGNIGNNIFGDRGNLLGGEMVYSHDRLMDDIRQASGGNKNITINVYQQPGEDAEELAERISRIMNDDYSRGQVAYG